MRQFYITVNGTGYQVSVEEVESASAPAFVAPPIPVAAPASIAPIAAPVAVAPVPAVQAAAPAAVADGEKVFAPMPGTILHVKVTVGSVVKRGDLLLVLEAMKMENEILSPVDATVKQVLVADGASVNSGDALIVLG